MKTIAAFDFDKTITTKDLLLPFLSSMNSRLKMGFVLLRMIPWIILFYLGLKSRQQVKEKLLKMTLPGHDILEKGEFFANHVVPHFLLPSALKKMEWHRSQGHELVIISANLDCFINPVGKNLRFDKVICTRLVYPPTGKIDGLNCYGEEKARRLLEAYGPKENFTLYAYGDSKGDEALLKLADYPFFRHFQE